MAFTASRTVIGQWLDVHGLVTEGFRLDLGRGMARLLMTCFPPLTPQGSLALALPVGAGVVQSLAFHPTEPCLLTATGGRIQCWREEAYEAEGGAG